MKNESGAAPTRGLGLQVVDPLPVAVGPVLHHAPGMTVEQGQGLVSSKKGRDQVAAFLALPAGVDGFSGLLQLGMVGQKLGAVTGYLLEP